MIRVRSELVLIVLLLLTGTLACKSNKTGASNSQAGNGNANAQAEGQPGGVAGGKSTGGRAFRGNVGGNGVQMTLTMEGDQLAGTYFYQKSSKENSLSLKGTINGQGDFMLQEFDGSGKQTGEFKGKWSDQANLPAATLEGTWSKPNSKDSLFFYATEQMVAFTNGIEVVSRVINEENKAKKYSIRADYPELTGASNPNVAKFNQEVKNLITKETQGFKGDAASSAEYANAGTGSDLEIWFNIVLATDDLVSVLFDVSNYSAGAAHPNGYSLAVNFDLKSGKTLKLSELFQPNSNYLDSISRYSIDDLKKQMGKDSDTDWIQKGAGPDSENFANWNISKKGLAITFDPYQVASYADGPKHIVVPYPVLKDVSKPDGPLSLIGK
jgi:hypothetical protein